MGDIALPITGGPSLTRGRRLLSDERLARQAARGDARAFAALYERNHQAIYRYCRSILRHDHDAQEALQSAMTRAYAALRAQERDLAVRPWLFRIAHNEAISILRKRRASVELSEDCEHLHLDVEDAVETRERLRRLVADLQSLSERQKAALVMRELSGLSIEEIASALAISQGAAKQTLFEARSSLHDLAEGRAMSCESIRQTISSADGRALRGRRVRAHLQACEECRSFQAAIDTRRADLRAIAPPLPGFAAGALLTRVLAHGGGHGGGAAVSGASLGSHAAASLVVKGLSGVAILAAATAGAVRLSSGHGHGAGHAHPAARIAKPPQLSSPTSSGHTSERLARKPPAGKPGGRSASLRAAGGPLAARTGSSPATSSTLLSISSPVDQPTGHGQSRHEEGSAGRGSEHGRGERRHRREGAGSTRAHKPVKSHGSQPRKPSHESGRKSGQRSTNAQGSPSHRSGAPAGEEPGHGPDAGSQISHRAEEVPGAQGTGSSAQAPQAMPQAQPGREGVARR